MNINPTQSLSHEAMVMDETENLIVVGYFHLRKRSYQRKNLQAIMNLPASQFSDYKRMSSNRTGQKKLS